MVAHRAQLFGLAVGRVRRIVDGVCRPNADKAIYSKESAGFFLESQREAPLTSSGCDEPLSIRRDMAAVDLKILLLAAMREPYWTNVFHGSSLKAPFGSACLAEGI